MITITEKEQCCGCSACVQRCPQNCISMQKDSEGFLYPEVDVTRCIDCHLCEKVCPVINQNESRFPLEVYAAKNTDTKVRQLSSSGGIFTLLAEQTIKDGGVVFGACWDVEWNVGHDYAETLEDIVKFKSSKYLQSIIGESYKKAEYFLKTGRKVMFTGTPCQIAGLKHFLRKEYTNLLAVEVICHSVPSPGIWQEYLADKLSSLNKTKADVKSISFRDKSTGWNSYSFVVESKDGRIYKELSRHNLFMKGFLADLYTRPSCYACPAKELKSGSDITLGDFWGIETLLPELDDDRGISAVTVNTEKGRALLQDVNAELTEVTYNEVVKRNSALVHSASEPKGRRAFFEADGLTFEAKIKKLAKTPFSLRLFIGKLAYSILPNKMLRNIIRHIRNIKKNK